MRNMKTLVFALLLSGCFLVAQGSSWAAQDNANDSKRLVTLRGCVTRSSGDYVLMKQDPAEILELQSTHKIRLKNYLGQRVEVTGTRSPSMSTSSDATRTNAAPVTLTITSIKTLSKDCSAQPVN
jgi:hypothetical protein